jgi:WD40 repeat protein
MAVCAHRVAATLSLLLTLGAPSGCGGRELSPAPASRPTPLNAKTPRSPAAPAASVVVRAADAGLGRSARQVVQRAPTGGLGGAVAVSTDGIAVTWSDDEVLRFWHLPSRSLVRAIPASQLDGGHFVRPVRPVWDDATHEALLARGDGVLAVSVEGRATERAWPDVDALYPTGAKETPWVASRLGALRGLGADGQSRAALRAPGRIGDIAFARNARVAVAATERGLLRWSLDAGGDPHPIALPARPVAFDAVAPGASMALSADGTSAWVCAKQNDAFELVIARGLGGATKMTTVALPGAATCDVVVPPDESIAVVATGDELVGMDASSGAPRWRALVPGGVVTSLALSSDGREALAMTADGTVSLVDAHHGDALGELGAKLWSPGTLAFQKDGRLLATSLETSIFGRPRHAALWSLERGTLSESTTIDWGLHFDLAEDGALRVARVETHSRCQASERAVTFGAGTMQTGAPARDEVVCLPKATTVRAVDATSRRTITEDPAAKAPALRYQVRDGTGSAHALRDVPSGGLAGTDLWFSEGGQFVLGAAGARGAWGSLHVWNAVTGAKIGVFTADPADPAGIAIGPGAKARKGFAAAAVSNDGEVLAVGGSDAVTLYSMPSKKPLRTVMLPPSAWVTSLAFAPGSASRLFVGSGDGALVSVADDGSIRAGRSEGGAIRVLAIRRDGERVATGSEDGAVRLWSSRGEPIATLAEFTDGESIATTPNGAYVGTPESTSRIRWVFDAPTEGFSFERFARAFARPDVVARRLADGATDVETPLERPPRVELGAVPASATAADRVTITARVGGARPIDTLHAFVEGRDVAMQKIGAASADVTMEVPLLPGRSTIALVAFDDAGASSNAAEFEVRGPETAGARPELWIVAAGVGRYPNLAPELQLEATVDDARAMAAAFAAQAGPGKLYAAAHVTLLLDEQVTRDAVTGAVARLSAMKPSDVAVVFLAGHGVKTKSGEMMFLTSPATMKSASVASAGVGWSALGSALATARGRVVVLLDACHSGHVSQELVVPNSALAKDLVEAQRAGVVVFAASKGRQLSYETNTSRGLVLDATAKQLVEPSASASTPVGHGYFTGAILRSLAAPATDVNRDGVVQLGELVNAVTFRVTKVSEGRQTPWVARRELFGDFALARATR